MLFFPDSKSIKKQKKQIESMLFFPKIAAYKKQKKTN